VSATQGGIQDFHFILSRVPEIWYALNTTTTKLGNNFRWVWEK
jgi:hypothetical protein